MSQPEAFPYRILLYYYYTPLEDVAAVVAEQEAKCRALGLLGRILVAPEGLNGTASGPTEATQAYMDWMQAHPLFPGIEFKVDPHEGHAFHKLHVREKQEIVHFGHPSAPKPWEVKPPYVEPHEMRQLLENPPEDLVILDARSNYETAVGRFKGALTLDLENFRDLPGKLPELEALRGKQIVTYCTGGIKCEKVAAWLMSEGFENVRQLHGGIVRYGHEEGGAHFEGDCYVFDHRVVAPVNTVNPCAVGSCHHCGAPTSRSINCANAECNDQFLICDACAEEWQGTCSPPCLESPRRRAWDGTGHYIRGHNSKVYAQPEAGPAEQGS